MTENEEINAMLFAEVRGRQTRAAAMLFGKEQQQPPQMRGIGQPVPPGAGPDARESENAGMNRAILRSMGYPTPGDR